MSGTRRATSVTIPIRTDGVPKVKQDLNEVGSVGARALAQITGSATLARQAMSLFGPVLAGVSAGAMVAFTRRAIDTVGGLGELADQAGVTTDALQVLQFASVSSGVSIEEMQRGLSILTRTVADAASGTGTAAEAFARFGIALTDPQGNIRATEAILGDIADALQSVEDPIQRAALATSFFGDDLGQRLIPLLAGGREGLAEFERRARATGQVLDADLIAAADKAADRIAELQRTFGAFANNLALTVLPAVNAVLEAINRLVFGPSLAQRISEITIEIQRLETQIRSRVDPSLLGQFQSEADIDATNAGLEERIRLLVRERTRLESELASPPAAFQDRPGGGGAVTPRVAPQTQDNRARAGQIAALEEYERALDRTGTSLDRFAEDSADVFNGIADASVRAMKGVEDAIINAAQTGRMEWRGLVNSILADLARLVIRQTITGPLASALSSGLQSLIPTRAMGGPVFAGQAYRVGEFGPETFVPSTTGRVVPNGGAGVTVNLSVGVGVAQTVQAEIRNLLPAITSAVQSGVADRAQRGGGFAAAVRGG